jgi:deoxyribonuclease-4
MTTPEGVTATMDEFDREIGLDLLTAVHANDSKSDKGSSTDRHENIGEGHIGLDGFRAILGNQAFANVPMYLEVPGTEKSGPNQENLDALKNIRTELGLKRQ